MNYKNINKKRCRDASFFCQSFLCIPQKKEEILKTIFPDVFMVDYVKVYQKEEGY